MEKEKLRVISLFSGIGAFEKALTNLKINYDLINFSEIDKFAIKSYCSIHNVSEEKNLGDINNINLETLDKNIDLLFFGSPCQDFSVAGQGKGAQWTCLNCNYTYNPLIINYRKRKQCPKCNSNNISKTRSSLLVEALRLIEYIKPKYIVYENVKNLIGKKFINIFKLFIKELECYGYNVKYQVLNAKDFNIPQNRERIFVVAIKNDIQKEFNFPKKKYLPTFFNLYNANEIKNIAPTVLTTCGTMNGFSSIIILSNLRIRKLTPKETFRLMGFSDEDFYKAKKVVSDYQIYKQSGNSIVVNVIEEIFKELFKELL